ncbi:MAG: hypothetical protein LKJ21_09570 [Oscillospiraceae bacterium]|jgi:hypothetical protein|nr:hypothetical protein [Oscillospiraceae bacterium]MCI1990749.1 hypothetical protein [Oscillospiraceae bacterium]MCI2035648.1 hypothetical protein [Oscillospiraceae bacterium]
MDYSGFHEFPFPSVLNDEGEEAKAYFLSLPDEDQLHLLNGCRSYEEFYRRVLGRMEKIRCP